MACLLNTGVARALLSTFKEYIPLPYYHGEQINFRSIDIDSTHQIKVVDEIPSLKIYPNPAEDFVTIEWPPSYDQPEDITIINMLGQKIINSENFLTPKLRFETHNWNQGIYLIFAQSTSGKLLIGKFIKLTN